MPAITKPERYAVIILAFLLASGFGLKHYKVHAKALKEVISIESFNYDEITNVAGHAPLQEHGRVNINTASLEELMSLKGIGETIAGRIMEHRNSHGPFSSAEGLKAVRGISGKILIENQDRIAVDDS